jgi:prepilin-type N-terminal cleavage/methylation domain-containing protein
MNSKSTKRGYTLVEVILASLIFTIVSVMGATIFVQVTRIQQRILLESAIYEDGRFMMERIGREIKQNAVDYEEYYNVLVEGGEIGQYYGCYATRFYDPGEAVIPIVLDAGPENGGFSAYCNDGTPVKDSPGCVILKNTLDTNTGENPYIGIGVTTHDYTEANAFCDELFGGDTDCEDTSLYKQDVLYLIDAKGEQKTILRLKAFSPTENAVAMIRLLGEDDDGDGIVEEWFDGCDTPFCCHPDFDCSGDIDDLNDDSELYEGFVPISPLRTNIKNLTFYVAPYEDPRKGFHESASDIQQPHVTVVMTLQPSDELLRHFNIDKPPTITFQNTYTSRVQNDVRSYFGVGVCDTYTF